MIEALGVLLLVGTGLGLIALITCINLWDRRRRSKMTAAERAADDEMTRQELAIW
jgi:hypothetical protein